MNRPIFLFMKITVILNPVVNLLTLDIMRKRKLFFLMVIISGVFLTSCEQEPEWRALFNGENLDGFDTYLGKSLGGEWDSISQAATTESVFSVIEQDGEKVIRISGEINGSLATQESFENYHLRLVFKWGETVYSRRNSGLLYHSFGDFGVAIDTWMTNIELQLMHENLGDTYLMMNTACETPAEFNDETNQWLFTPFAERQKFGLHANGPLVRKLRNVEKPLGQWNVVDLYCFDDVAVHVVNGETVMINYNTGVFENDAVKPLTSGKIQIQSEGAELFIKSLDVKPITEIPTEVLL